MSPKSSQYRLTRRAFLQGTAVLGTVAGLTALAGCAAPAAQQAGDAGEPGADSWHVVYWKPPHSAKAAEVWEPLLQRFMDANPGVTVDHQVIPWGNVDEQFTAAFAGGSPPDVFYLPDEWYPKYVNQGQILDLTDRHHRLAGQLCRVRLGTRHLQGQHVGSAFPRCCPWLALQREPVQ